MSTQSIKPSIDSTTQNTWNPTKYMSYMNIRERPGIELMTRLVYHYNTIKHQINTNNELYIYDLGCGTGNLTEKLYESIQSNTDSNIHIHTTGIDSSTSMIQHAASHNQYHSIIRYIPGDVSQSLIDNSSADIIFSNACYHWIHSHHIIYPMLVNQLKLHTGLLAIQIPNNFNSPYHTQIASVLEDLQLIDIDYMNDGHTVGHYYSMETHDMLYYDKLLSPLCDIVDIWQTEYNQVLTGQMYIQELNRLSNGVTALNNINIDNHEYLHPVVNFTMGSALTAVLPKLTTQQQIEFLYLYNRRMIRMYPVQQTSDADNNGLVHVRVIFPFNRLFLIAKRK